MENLLEVENTKKEMKKNKLELFIYGSWLGDIDYEDSDDYFIYENYFLSNHWELNVLHDVQSDDYDSFDALKRTEAFKKHIQIDEQSYKNEESEDVEKLLITSFEKKWVNKGHYGTKFVKEWYECDIYTEGDFDPSKVKFEFLQVGRNKNNLSIKPHSIIYDGKRIDLEFSYGMEKGQDIIESWNELKSYLN